MSDNKEHIDFEAMRKQWEVEVKENIKTQEFLESYEPCGWNSLYKQYALSKMLAYKNADFYRENNELHRNQWLVAAQEHLSIIQQKKLFDAQCKWRAGLEIYDEIEITYDFKLWEQDVMNCLFLEQPSTFDIELYGEYLTQEYADIDSSIDTDWQDYEELKEAYATEEENINMPTWYEFHNNKTGNGVLLTLPDIKGNLERGYINLANKENNKNKPPAASSIPHSDAAKPYLNYYDKKIHLELAKIIENKEMFHIMREYVEGTEHYSVRENEKALEDLHYLSQIKDEVIPIEAHQDYRIALSRAWNKYRYRKIAEHLPLALEFYQKNRYLQELGINNFVEEEDHSFYKYIRKKIADVILQGRELQNEPRDFNF